MLTSKVPHRTSSKITPSHPPKQQSAGVIRPRSPTALSLFRTALVLPANPPNPGHVLAVFADRFPPLARDTPLQGWIHRSKTTSAALPPARRGQLNRAC